MIVGNKAKLYQKETKRATTAQYRRNQNNMVMTKDDQCLTNFDHANQARVSSQYMRKQNTSSMQKRIVVGKQESRNIREREKFILEKFWNSQTGEDRSTSPLRVYSESPC